MKSITVRELLRDIKQIYPIPESGVQVVSRDREDFYIYPTPKGGVDISLSELKSQEIADRVVEYLKKTDIEKNTTTLPVSVVSVPITPAINVSINALCQIKQLLMFLDCRENAEGAFKVASLLDGTPMEGDWKTIQLCRIHRDLIRSHPSLEMEE